MKNVSKLLLATALAAMAALPATGASARIVVGVDIGVPPAERMEVVPGRPWDDGVWIKGHWAWRGQWVWIDGHWAHPGFHGAHWVPGHYGPHGGWIEGHWHS
ncbi:MAG TPA: hypothetical protein VGG48_13460 [Rhizomicrobium sp.]|jgi:hypothetical protein